MQITMMGIATLTSGQAQWRELQKQGLNPLVLAKQVSCQTSRIATDALNQLQTVYICTSNIPVGLHNFLLGMPLD